MMGGGGGLLSLLFWGAFAVILLQVVQGVMRNQAGACTPLATAVDSLQLALDLQLSLSSFCTFLHCNPLARRAAG